MWAVDDVVGVRQAGHRDSKFLFLRAGASNKKLVSLPSSLGVSRGFDTSVIPIEELCRTRFNATVKSNCSRTTVCLLLIEFQ